MLSTQKQTSQIGLFPSLADILNQKHPMYHLANKINWSLFEDAFKKYYSEKMGAPSKPIRLMVSLLILKYVRNLSDENVVEQWSENNYFQYFSGEQFFQPKIPCVPTELVAFRNRMGEPGLELILQESIRVNDPPKDNNQGIVVSVDITVQEKNITYPTDDKLYKKIIKISYNWRTHIMKKFESKFLKITITNGRWYLLKIFTITTMTIHHIFTLIG